MRFMVLNGLCLKETWDCEKVADLKREVKKISEVGRLYLLALSDIFIGSNKNAPVSSNRRFFIARQLYFIRQRWTDWKCHRWHLRS